MSTGTLDLPLVAESRFYGDEPLLLPKTFLRKARKALRDVDFDTVVGTGMSGVPAATLLGNSMNKHILLVRKPDDGMHHMSASNHTVGRLGKRWIFVDDFVSSGTTRLRVATCVLELYQRLSSVDPFTDEPPLYVGAYLFRDGWKPSDDGSIPGLWAETSF